MRIADCGMGERREAQPDFSQGCQAQEFAPNPLAVGCSYPIPQSAFRIPQFLPQLLSAGNAVRPAASRSFS